MTYISWSSEFALYLEDCLMYEHHTMGQYDLTFNLKIMLVTVTYISWSGDFVLYLQDYLMDECHIFR